MPRLRREKHLLTCAMACVLERHSGPLPAKNGIIQMVLTNLRNRPLSTSNIQSMSDSMLSLYHSLVTGSKDFPVIVWRKVLISSLIATPFPRIKQGRRENTRPTVHTFQPAGMIVPSQRSSSPPNILTAVHPEKTELGALRADPRNCVRDMELDGSTVTRAISTVYRTDTSELSNCWRVSDYSADGVMLMSVLCQFNKKTTDFLNSVREMKRKVPEDQTSSSTSPPKKRLRL